FRGQLCKILKTTVGAVSEAQARQREASKNDRPMSSGPGTVGGHRPPLQFNPGTAVMSKGHLAVMCGDGNLLEILSIQPESRKAVSGADFANGWRIQAGEKFQSVMDN